jgi:ankyrin repeat protein
MKRIGLSSVLLLALASGCSHEAATSPMKAELNSSLFQAIRDGDAALVQSLLGRGANANARDETGSTALMEAALNADANMVRLLLDHGADVDAENRSGATALLWALHDRQKVQLLLDHGADPKTRGDSWGHTTLIVAAKIPGTRATLQLLREREADLSANTGGFTPLMAAALSGDLENVKYLIEQGADVRAKTPAGYTALHAAAFWGDADMVRFLLDRGADPNAQVQISHHTDDVGTPAIVAALSGNTRVLPPLLDRGADVNVQGGAVARTALLCAATTSSEEAVRALLGKGARVNEADRAGNTPLDWAKRRGQTAIVKLLQQAGARSGAQAKQVGTPPTSRLSEDSQATTGARPVEQAVRKVLPLLQQSGQKFTEKVNCFSCHHQGLVAMTVALARGRGFAVNEEIAKQERLHILEVLGEKRQSILLGFGVTDPPVPAYALTALAAEGQEPNHTTDALVHHLILSQRNDGRWQTPVNRPPHDASDFAGTALSVRVLPHYAPGGRRQEVEGRVARARSWLVSARPPETEDKTFRLLGLRWAGAEDRYTQEAAAGLLGEQRPDGGWAQLPTLPSDAYATGQVLFALHEGGGLAVDDPAYQRGVQYLLQSQLADGSWLVRTRSFPFQPYFNSGFPHGHSQFISCAATCWATMALTLTIPEKSVVRSP